MVAQRALIKYFTCQFHLSKRICERNGHKIHHESASVVIKNHRSKGMSPVDDVYPSVRGCCISRRSQVQRKHIFRGCRGLKINILSRVAPPPPVGRTDSSPTSKRTRTGRRRGRKCFPNRQPINLINLPPRPRRAHVFAVGVIYETFN